jgi:hypothetical protein
MFKEPKKHLKAVCVGVIYSTNEITESFYIISESTKKMI